MENEEKELVFKIGFEGGSFPIYRKIKHNKDVFTRQANSLDLLLFPDLYTMDQEIEFTSFQSAFEIQKYKNNWIRHHLDFVHPYFREYISQELIILLNQQRINPNDNLLSHLKEQFEKVLTIRLIYDYIHTKNQNGLQKIYVENLMNVSEYEYQEFTPESGQEARIKGKFETFNSAWNSDNFYLLTDAK